jgi:hypothetical protein
MIRAPRRSLQTTFVSFARVTRERPWSKSESCPSNDPHQLRTPAGKEEMFGVRRLHAIVSLHLHLRETHPTSQVGPVHSAGASPE